MSESNENGVARYYKRHVEFFNYFAALLPYDPTVREGCGLLLDLMLTQLIHAERISKTTDWANSLSNFFGALDTSLSNLTTDLFCLNNRLPEGDYELIKRCILCIQITLPVLESI